MTLLIIPLPFVLLKGNCGKEEEKIQKSEYLENEASFLDEIKNIFTVFKGLSFGKKIKT